MQKRTTKKQQRIIKQQASIIQKLSIKEIVPLTDAQERVYDQFEEGKNLVLHGLAGTGKSYISLYLALDEVMCDDSPYQRVIVVRSAVPSRDIGYMPGSLKDKIKVYESPYEMICNNLFDNQAAYAQLKSKHIIDFQSTSFLRGLTFDNTIIIIDEVQNMTSMELHTILTRIGNNTRFIMCGDYRQDDLADKRTEQSGLKQTLDVLKLIPSVSIIEFGIKDIVRSGFVKQYIIARNELGMV